MYMYVRTVCFVHGILEYKHLNTRVRRASMRASIPFSQVHRHKTRVYLSLPERRQKERDDETHKSRAFCMRMRLHHTRGTQDTVRRWCATA